MRRPDELSSTRLTVADCLVIPPLDLGALIAGHRGLDREVRWVDIIHAPAQAFVRPGDLVLTTGADVREEAVRDFLGYLLSSSAAGIVLSPPREVSVSQLLASLVPLADDKDFPVIVLPWEVPFADVMRGVLARLDIRPLDIRVDGFVGRAVKHERMWKALIADFCDALVRVGAAEGVHFAPSFVNDSANDAVIAAVDPSQAVSRVQRLIRAAHAGSGLPTEAVRWSLLPSGTTNGPGPMVALSGDTAPAAPVEELLQVLRSYPPTAAKIMYALKPLFDYDRERGGQLVSTLRVLSDENWNTSAAARRLFLNRHSLLYRVGLMEQLTGLDVSSPRDRFLLELCARAYRGS